MAEPQSHRPLQPYSTFSLDRTLTIPSWAAPSTFPSHPVSILAPDIEGADPREHILAVSAPYAIVFAQAAVVNITSDTTFPSLPVVPAKSIPIPIPKISTQEPVLDAENHTQSRHGQPDEYGNCRSHAVTKTAR